MTHAAFAVRSGEESRQAQGWPGLEPAVLVKRLLSRHDGLGHGQTGDPAARLRAIRWFTALLARCLNEIDRLTAADHSTGS